jgi:drug/metabolite transporter (DMT)-like permease
LYPLVSILIAIVALHESIGWREGLGIVLALISVIALSWERRAEEKRIETSNIQQPAAK